MRDLLQVVGACLLMAIPAIAQAMPAPGEMEEAQRWAATGFAAAKPQPPFSFLLDGRPSSEIIQGWRLTRSERRLDPQRVEHTLQYTDPDTALRVECEAIEYRDFPAVEWVLHLRNTGNENTPIIEQIEPLDLQIAAAAASPLMLHYSLGDDNSENSFAPVRRSLAPGEAVSLAPGHGRSSEGYLPFFNVQRRGGGMVIAVGWSGQWEADFRRGADGATRVRAGMQTTHLRLYPGEVIRTPRILLLFWSGGSPLRGTNLLRQILLAHYLPRRSGQLVLPPICASVGEVDPDGSYEGPHIRVMPILAARGIEVFWSDMDPQQWYPGGFPDGTGTWEPDPTKYPRGLAPIGQAAHAAGLQYLLWFEPERAHAGTAIDKLHPEWLINLEGKKDSLFRLGDPQARKWLTDYIDLQITAANLDWLRWDFNITPLSRWRSNDTPDRQGMTEIGHIEGLYAMWDDLQRRHPGLIVDICASGGRRIDLETLSRGLPLWHSDLQCFGPHPAADQLQNGGLSLWLPLHGCGNFGYEPSYVFRSAMTAGNVLCSSAHAADSADAVKRSVAATKKARPYMLGDFYPLFPHDASEEAWYGYQFHRPDLDAGVAMVFRREKNAQPVRAIRLAGVNQKSRYAVAVEDSGREALVTGKALRALEVEIPEAPSSAVVYYRKVEQ